MIQYMRLCMRLCSVCNPKLRETVRLSQDRERGIYFIDEKREGVGWSASLGKLEDPSSLKVERVWCQIYTRI